MQNNKYSNSQDQQKQQKQSSEKSFRNSQKKSFSDCGGNQKDCSDSNKYND